jgi:hypothetical protein
MDSTATTQAVLTPGSFVPFFPFPVVTNYYSRLGLTAPLDNHNQLYRTGTLQSRNKFSFTSWYIDVVVSPAQTKTHKVMYVFSLSYLFRSLSPLVVAGGGQKQLNEVFLTPLIIFTSVFVFYLALLQS